MPGYFELEESPGFFVLAGGDGILLLSEPDMPAPNDAILYETDRIESAFVTIIQNALPSGVQFVKKRDAVMDQTPRVEYVLTLQQNNTQRHLRYLDNSFAPAQPLNSWNYTLQPTIVTNRTTNGGQHTRIVGVVRQSLQYYSLLNTWDASVAPYHAITSIGEAQTDNTIESDGDLDMQRLTFSGMCNIRDSAWPAV